MMKIKDLQKVLKSASPVRAVFPSDDERIQIRVTSEDIYSDVNSSLPSPDVMEYLFNVADHVQINESLRVLFPADTDIERAKIAYTSYIAFELNKCMKELKRLSWKIFMFVFVGAAILTISYFLEGFGQRVITDSVNIIGGFSIWEAADTFVFARAEKRREVISRLKLYDAEWYAAEDGKHC